MNKFFRCLLTCLLSIFILPACASRAKNGTKAQMLTPALAASTVTPQWFNVELTDAQTGDPFTISDYTGKVVLVETMAIWCPTCILQAAYIYKLHNQLGNPDDLISVSLDVDLHEDTAMLKKYTIQYGFDWHFAVAPLEVDRALGNLYNAEYLNPPLAPMLIIDRKGNVHLLEYGLKDTETLRKAVEPFLAT